MTIDVIKSNRRTIEIKILDDLTVRVKVPKFMSKKEINKYIDNHMDWINGALALQKEKNESIKYLTDEEIQQCIEKANDVLPQKTLEFAKMMDVDIKKISIKSLKCKWGSCSSDGHIILNYKIMLAPQSVWEYVIIHELAHRVYMNHSHDFYNLIKKYKPDYKESISYLKQNGYVILKSFERKQ